MPYLKVEFPGGVGADFKPYYEEAIDFWNSVVLSGAPPLTFKKELDLTTHQCGVEYTIPAGFTLEGLMIFASTPFIDGEGQILGRAGPCYMDQGTYFPRLGIMEFDSADSAFMLNSGTYGYVVIHEMGHVIGIGTLWPIKGLLQDPCSIIGLPRPCDPYYIGLNGLEGYLDLNPPVGLESLPAVANTGGLGTANGHWREVVFQNELMSGYLNADVENPLSIMTIKSLKDLGYVVDESPAQEYTIPEPGTQRGGLQMQLQGDILTFNYDADFELPEFEKESDSGAVSGLLMVMIAGFLMLVGLQMYLSRDVRQAMDKLAAKRTGVANANPMHLQELA